MRTLIVNRNDVDQRLDKFLGKTLRGMPQSMLYKAIRKKRVKVNGSRAEISYRLREGDKIELYINDEFFDSGEELKEDLSHPRGGISVVYEDENILVSDKPSGMPCHTAAGVADDDTLISRVRAYLFQKDEYDPASENSFAPALCNRLDRNTSGLVLAAKNAAALRFLNEKIKTREIEKYYICSVVGVPDPPSGKIETYLKKDEKTNRVSVLREYERGAKRAVTEYSLLRKTKRGAVLEVRLITGRTHQIRAHMAYIGCPVEGDVKYGAPRDGGRSFQHLRAYKLAFNFEGGGGMSYLSGKVITAPEAEPKSL